MRSPRFLTPLLCKKWVQNQEPSVNIWGQKCFQVHNTLENWVTAFPSDDSEQDSTHKAQTLQKACLKLGQEDRKLKARLGYNKTCLK